jgi:hypothetical protein
MYLKGRDSNQVFVNTSEMNVTVFIAIALRVIMIKAVGASAHLSFGFCRGGYSVRGSIRAAVVVLHTIVVANGFLVNDYVCGVARGTLPLRLPLSPSRARVGYGSVRCFSQGNSEDSTTGSANFAVSIHLGDLDIEGVTREIKTAYKQQKLSAKTKAFLLQVIKHPDHVSIPQLLRKQKSKKRTTVKPPQVTQRMVSRDDSVTTEDLLSHLIKIVDDIWTRLREEEQQSTWKSLRIFVNYRDGTLFGFKGDRAAFREHLKTCQEQQNSKFQNKIKQVTVNFGNNKPYRFEAPFDPSIYDELDLFFGVGREARLHELKVELTSMLRPLRQANNETMIKANVAFVPRKDGLDILQESYATDKLFAEIVAGKSGSGKSVYACQAALDENFYPIYCMIDGKEDLKTKPTDNLLLLRELFERIEMACTSKGISLDSLQEMKKGVNQDHNEWASEVLDSAIGRVMTSQNAKSWWGKKWPKELRPDNVAIIVDEAVDKDLADGLVSIVRQLPEKYQFLYRESLRLVVVGTGLDAIKAGPRVGSDSALSRVIMLKTPDMKKLERAGAISTAVYKAIMRGTFARVTKTNARMLFRSTIPILSLRYHKTDAATMDELSRSVRYTDRLCRLASFGPFMDHAIRYYVNQNSIGTIEKHKSSKKLRQDYLDESFLYHLDESIKTIVTEKNTSAALYAKKELELLSKYFDAGSLEEDPLNIFSIGLAVRQGLSSPALKYLACFGLTCPTRPGYGDNFEELVALHSERLLGVQGYLTSRIDLISDWPPQASNKLDAEEFQRLDQKLKGQFADERDHVYKILEDRVPQNGRFAIVFMQASQRAQGGDVLVLKCEGSHASLESIQCKNEKSRTIKKDWWNALGVDFVGGGSHIMDKENVTTKNDKGKQSKTNTGSDNLAEIKGMDIEKNETDTSHPIGKLNKADYSYRGLQMLAEVLTDVLEKLGIGLEANVTLGARIMAVSSSGRGFNHAYPACKDIRIWYREMLEPTFSTFSIASEGKNNTNSIEEPSE